VANEIERKISQLPADVRAYLLEYIDFLTKRHISKHQSKEGFRFDWEGGLAELKDEYTSVELQHKASEWR